VILARASWHYLRRHPWLVMLSVLGVALGVAVVVAVDLANESARRAFLLSAETLSGRTTHHVIGGPQGLPEEVYRRLRAVERMRASAPVVEGYARTVGNNSRTLQILGVDPFADGKFRSFVDVRIEQAGFIRWLTEPATGMVTERTATRLAIEPNQALTLAIGDKQHRVTIVGLVATTDPVVEQALDSVLLTDIATAQELLGMGGYLSRIDLIIAEGDRSLLQRLRTAMPRGAEIIAAGKRSRALDQMTRAFRVNLTALSLLALLVGAFLIYNIMTFSVVQRRELIGTLRAVGVTRLQVFAHIISEALAIGLIGTLMGMLLGVVLGKGLIEHVVQTINDLYFVLSVTDITLTPFSFVKGILLGITASVAAALLPAWEATRTQVAAVLRRSAIETQWRRHARAGAFYGLSLALLASVVLLIPSRSLVLSYSSLFVVIVAFALLVPFGTSLLMRACGPVMSYAFGMVGRMAARGVAAALSRTGVAIAALAVAISATVGVGVMIDSFRHSFIDWLDGTLTADIYVSAPVIDTAPSAPVLDRELAAHLASLPGVASISTTRRVRIDGAEGTFQLRVLDISEEHFARFRFKHGSAGSAWQALQEDEAVIVSEPYAYRHRLGLGDMILLRTDSGARSFRVAGIYYDYGSDEGRITIGRRIYDRYWSDRQITAMALYAAAGANTEDLLARARRVAGEHDVFIRSNQALRAASVEVFDRTFTITAVLRLLVTIVAFIGVLSALMALQLERARELAVLRVTGLTPPQVWQLLSAESGLMGFAAGVLALPLGIGLALVLVLVINRRSFGWSLDIFVDPAILLEGVALGILAAILAGLYPAKKMASVPPALVLREE
jgi:putative ABC transport system permease protein